MLKNVKEFENEIKKLVRFNEMSNKIKSIVQTKLN